MRYVQSLRFKLMKLCVIPLVSVAALFVGHSVFIAYQVRSMAADAQPVSGIASLNLGFLGTQWAVFFLITLSRHQKSGISSLHRTYYGRTASCRNINIYKCFNKA